MGARKYLFAIFAATVAMAFIGAGSASATVLCNDSVTTGCKAYEKGAALEASLTATTTLSTTGGTVLDECASGTIAGTTSNKGGSTETVSAPLSELSWGSCTKTTDTVSNGELEIHWISGSDNGTVTGKSASVTVNTIFGTCTYGTGAALDLGTLKGGNPATIEINATVLKQAGGFGCPAEAKWVANYSVASPQPLYVGENASALVPTITIENPGPLADKGTKFCTFTAVNQVCSIKITNLSLFNVVVKTETLQGIEASKRFKVKTSCKKPIAEKGGVCTAEVESIMAVVAGWRNSYYLEIEEEGNATSWTAAFAFLHT